MQQNSISKGSIIRLIAEAEAQYKVLHRHVFPEVLQRIHKLNISDYSIFLHNGLLFSHMIYSGKDFALDMQAMAAHDVTREWWTITDNMQQPVEGCKTGEWWAELRLDFEKTTGKGSQRYAYSFDPVHIDNVRSIVEKIFLQIKTFKIFEGLQRGFLYLETDHELPGTFAFENDLQPMEEVFHTEYEPAKKVVVSGCFDMLHSGHVAFLIEAAGYGDLYVCIGSDSNVHNLKGRFPVVSQDERKYMIDALACVHECRINTGWGLIDFENELNDIKPDIFVVNEDGHTPTKEMICKQKNIEYKVLKRIPHGDLPVRSTTTLRTECTIPFRIDLAGGWIDQPFVSKFASGPVITISIEPTISFNERSGMASSTRLKAIELWHSEIPAGDKEQLAKMLFSYENPPGTKHVSGSQDSLGIVLPGLNRLYYENNYWPSKIDSVYVEEILSFIEENLYLITLGPRFSGYNVLENTKIDTSGAQALADAAENVWKSLLEKDLKLFGKSFRQSFEAQIAMFPNMVDEEIMNTIENYKNRALGWKLSGAGGGGYLILVSEKPIEEAIKIKIRRNSTF